VTFELERLQAAPGEKREELSALHDVVRGIVRELRETIYQLRANVSEELDLVTVAADYLVRWAERTGIRVVWTPATDDRLPYRVEQELWRILQEAIANVERHSAANQVLVAWEVQRESARLVISDDGRGFDPDRVGGDHYGLVGMQERADAIGARLRVDSRPGSGTRVIVDVELSRVPTDERERRTA
jgi:two-component system sensor histidine kinase DegS